ncbi:MAG: ABC-2 type transport system ATP-binding protein [Verrucomicrobiales bacterium]|jgi:ABC-2 type transport system ATP-binding protein
MTESASASESVATMEPEPEPKRAIVVRNLTRNFGSLRAVDGLSFEANEGEVVGFIGANGAGKTTTMRILATLDMQDSGSAEIGGYDVCDDPAQVRKILGWVPDAFHAYDNLTVAEYVDFFARAHGYTGAERRERVGEILNFTGLESLSDRLANKMSKGQTQRLCLCRALLHDPKVLILDEPAAGLDPQARVELKQLIKILSEEGRTLLISSHILSELGEMCDRLVFINNGKLLHDGASDEMLRGETGKVLVEIKVVPGSGDPSSVLELQPGVEIVETFRNGVRLSLETNEPKAHARLLKQIIDQGVQVIGYRSMERNLEDAFIEMLADANAPDQNS